LERFNDRVERKEMQRSGELGDRLRDAAKEELTQGTNKYLKPPDETALAALQQGTRTQNLLAWGGRNLNSIPFHLGLGIPSAGLANLPLWAASRGMRGLYNHLVGNQATATAQGMAQRSPYYQQLLSNHLQAQAAAQAGQAAQQGILAATQRAAHLGILGAGVSP
jgi:hypothetical protein